MAYNPGGQPPYNQQYPYNAPPPPPPPGPGMSTGAKVALFGCLGALVLAIVAVVVVAIVVVAMNKNGNAVSIGGTNTGSSNTNSSQRSTPAPPPPSSSGPSASGSGVHVTEIALARDNNDAAGDEVQSFSPTDNPMHAVVKLSDNTPGTKIRVVLMAVSVASGEKNTKVADIERDAGSVKGNLDTTFTLPRDWPTGTYRVDAYVNGKLDKSRTFEVES
jgi:hypothetical protein